MLLCTLWLQAQEPVKPVTHSLEQNSTQMTGTAVTTTAAPAAAAPSKSDYAEQYKGIAIAEMDRTGIPASIKLAQGILESASGESELAKNANNHFGIKCAGNWTGKTYHKKDDEHDDKGEKIESCFRKYSKPEESFYDHSEFLRDPRKYYRYGFLFSLDKRDYRAWARGLESSGYASGKGYADKLIDLIERYKLYQYDDPEIQAMNSGAVDDKSKKDKKDTSKDVNMDGKPAPLLPRVGRVNDVKVVIANKSETIDEIARTFRLDPQKVADYNERHYTPGKPLEVGTRVFIQKKRKKWRGRVKHHFVREEQTMFDISQQYGVRLTDLLKRNGMTSGQEPATGERVRVKGRRKSDEVVRLRNTSGGKSNTTQTPGRPATSPANSGDELFEIGGDPVPATPGTKPATGNPGSKPSTSPGSGKLPTDPVPATSGTAMPPQVTPPSTPQVTPPPAPVAPVTAPPGYHIVVKGDTLYSLSRKYNITVAKLKAMNGITNDAIQIGQKLKVQ